MPVEVHQTPNPNARKFVLPGVRFAAPRNFSSAEAAKEHPLAADLFTVNGVYNVLLAQDFVTVNKRPDRPWEALMAEVETVLKRHGFSGDDTLHAEA